MPGSVLRLSYRRYFLGFMRSEPWFLLVDGWKNAAGHKLFCLLAVTNYGNMPLRDFWEANTRDMKAPTIKRIVQETLQDVPVEALKFLIAALSDNEGTTVYGTDEGVAAINVEFDAAALTETCAVHSQDLWVGRVQSRLEERDALVNEMMVTLRLRGKLSEELCRRAGIEHMRFAKTPSTRFVYGRVHHEDLWKAIPVLRVRGWRREGG